jgi:hypothetical protein
MATQQHGPATFADPTTRRAIATGTLTTTDGKTIFETSDGSLANKVGHIRANSSSQPFGVVKTMLTTWTSSGVTTGADGSTHRYLVTAAGGI